MIKTKRLNAPPPIPYVVKYGPRGGMRTAGSLYDREADCPMTMVDFSFLRPRPCIPKCWDESPELIEELLKHITD